MGRNMRWAVLVWLAMGWVACAAEAGREWHSFGRPDQIRVAHVALDLRVDFDRKQLEGTAELTVARQPGIAPEVPLILDSRDLEIRSVQAGRGGDGPWAETGFEVGPVDAIRGAPVRITLPDGATRVRISYRTSPGASALQWVAPAGTAGKRKPFLYSQSQSIHARSWIPCQDAPGVRMTYSAAIQAPEGFTVVMSADAKGRNGDRHQFDMPRAIPAYLIALAVGELEFRPIGERTGVWAEPSVVGRAAAEFSDTESLLEAAEKRFGPYRWGRYDILVLPPSFPFGGMENAKLTFVTPTVLAGDRSLVALIAHELAHSWSGNLVTCAGWGDFWLNEGMTTYLERRITEDVFGLDRALMEWAIGRDELEIAFRQHEPRDQLLQLDLKGRDPDAVLSQIPYEKGALFLRRLEATFGRDRFDDFLRRYFDRFAFRSLSTTDFEELLKQTLFPSDPEAAKTIDLDAWLRRPGLPSNADTFHPARFDAVETAARRFASGELAAREIPTADWSTMEWVRFLHRLPDNLTAGQLAELDQAMHLTDRGNTEVVAEWLQHTIRAGYQPAEDRVESFLLTIGRNRYVTPLYRALARTADGRTRAEAIFQKARPAYHPMTAAAVERALQAR